MAENCHCGALTLKWISFLLYFPVDQMPLEVEVPRKRCLLRRNCSKGENGILAAVLGVGGSAVSVTHHGAVFLGCVQCAGYREVSRDTGRGVGISSK